MDFDSAAQRLKNDQSRALARSRASRQARSATAKARREAQASRRKAERRLEQKKLEAVRSAKIADRIAGSLGGVERDLGVSNVSKSTEDGAAKDGAPLAGGWQFRATSIHGEGDKISLPPSILEIMTSGDGSMDPWGGGRNGRPIAFRIGIRNPEYVFPSSDSMKGLVETAKQEVIESEKRTLSARSSISEDDRDTNDAEDAGEEAFEAKAVEAYLDELSHRYLAYTHGTVVEFTQEEGCVGLPEPIARALLQPNSHSPVAGSGNGKEIPVKRTVDPATSAARAKGDDPMDVDPPVVEEGSSEKTPGHPAYGLFGVPDLPIEIVPINSLPPGKDCTFTPTAASIKNGFYGLTDIKAVLEQSLMRTRATLSLGDVIRTWRRGAEFDLVVSSLGSSSYGAVSCVNTDLNIDFGRAEGAEAEEEGSEPVPVEAKAEAKPSGGRTLSDPSPRARPAAPTAPEVPVQNVDLPPEPPADVKEGTCTILIRGSSGTGKRRFDITTATKKNLFDFAASICAADPSLFRLVTRFPRRVFTMEDGGDATLESTGIGQGQEMFMLEML